MGHSIGDAIIVTALVAGVTAYLYFRHLERRRRLEIIHEERLAAMDKGIPLPELPLDTPKTRAAADPLEPLLHGVVWLSLGLGGIATLGFMMPGSGVPALWSLPLPLALLGVGLILYYVLAARRVR